jgi:bifunctional non-homologous end joining protein LigD
VPDAAVVERIGGHDVSLTRPDKVLFPEAGITKRDLVGYYRGIAPLILPFLEDRPLMMERYPDGIGKRPLIQKDASKYFPDWIATATVAKKGGSVRHVVCNDEATLAYLANQACVTPHTWLSRADALDQPDQMVFDLDPWEAGFAAVKKAARDLHGILDECGLPSFLKTTGSSGLHVVVPLKGDASFDEVRDLAYRIAQVLIAMDPATRTLEVLKAKRGGRLFVDINRNAYAQNYAPAWAVRAKPQAPVSVPLAWDELGRRTLRSDEWTIRTVHKRIEKAGDPWEGFWTSAVGYRKAVKQVEAHHGA